jgi:uncharacterized membrane protein YecN with MAPEG domain
MQQIYVVIFALCILALTGLFLWLSLQAVLLRNKHKVLVGDGGHKELAVAIRLHANFMEYVPFTLVLFLFAALAGTPRVLLLIIVVVFTVSRFLHAFIFGDSEKLGPGRTIGMLGTWASIGILGLCVFIWSLI